MSDILTKLYAAKAKALAEEQSREPIEELRARAEARRSERRKLGEKLRAASQPAIIAEIKRASPAHGLILRNFDAAEIARSYDQAAVDALSVLTESDHFLGELSYIEAARAVSSLPILRKDFLTTPYQIVQSAAYGADAVVLIVAGLDDAAIAQLTAEAERRDLEVLLEVHDQAELDRALACGAKLLGINNRDMRTFDTDLGTTEHLLPNIPAGVFAVSESGVSGPEDIARLFGLGARGFVIGAALMQADHPADLVAAIKERTVFSR